VSERILVCLAWPYANNSLHLGHVAGVYLPADIFARFQRMRGNEVLMVSGSDEHGTPITVRAEQEGKPPAEVAEHFHQEFLETWRRLGISWDLYTRTTTPNHYAVTQDMFLKLLDKGFIYKDTMLGSWSEADQRFLPDRYVIGTCPYCGAAEQRGDQCETCGRLLDPLELINPRSRFSGQPVVARKTEHFFLDLPRFNAALLDWVRRQEHWRPNVRNFTLTYLESGLQARAITRDIDWGVPVPVPGFEQKRIYVWFDAVIGYLSASIEWAQRRGDPERWRDWWQKPSRSYYFIGKDNIPFHTIIWPAMLMGYGGLNLPYDVPANEYLTMNAEKFSKSRGRVISVLDFLDQYDVDALRYALAINMPEQRDADFSLAEFVRRNNDELVATWGNLVHRTLSFLQRYFEGRVPATASPQVTPEVVSRIQKTFDSVTAHLQAVRFKDPLREIMQLAQFGNRFFDERAPWKQIKEDRDACAQTMADLLALIDALKLFTYPYMPFAAERLHAMLGYSDPLPEQGWALRRPPAGQALPPPKPLFQKLELPA